MRPTQDLPLFVYGSLKSIGAQSQLLGTGRRRPGTIRGRLYGLPAGYPAVALEEEGIVHGEWLDPVPRNLLALLDTYEGVPEGLFERRVVEVSTSAVRFSAWAWVMEDPRSRGGTPIKSGRWRPVIRR